MKSLRDIFPIREDVGTGAISGGSHDLGTGAIQNFDPVISFQVRNPKKKKRINKNK